MNCENIVLVDNFAALFKEVDARVASLIPIEVMTSSGPRGQREALKSNISVACFFTHSDEFS